ncbi:hypothetical protein RRSWK_06595 [Rhodopirellula sp. SWK7]|nr:hypothetical protein RRSWK_06595 [Rhodopirellula sp. SWK7]
MWAGNPFTEKSKISFPVASESALMITRRSDFGVNRDARKIKISETSRPANVERRTSVRRVSHTTHRH